MNSMSITNEINFDFKKFENSYFNWAYKSGLTNYDETRETGYYALLPSKILNNIQALKNEGIIKEKDKFIDLGSGLGFSVVCAAYKGLDAYGIEISQMLFEGSKKLIEHLKNEKIINQDAVCNFAEGSYFPNEYSKLRNEKYFFKNKSIAKKYEVIPKKNKVALCTNTLHTKENNFDVYEKLGVKLNEIDLFYSFCWEENVPSILEIFSLYAKDDAMMIFESAGFPKKANKLLDELNLNIVSDTRLFNRVTKK